MGPYELSLILVYILLMIKLRYFNYENKREIKFTLNSIANIILFNYFSVLGLTVILLEFQGVHASRFYFAATMFGPRYFAVATWCEQKRIQRTPSFAWWTGYGITRKRKCIDHGSELK